MGFCVARISTFLEGTGNTLETFDLSHQCHAKKILNVIGSHDALPFCLLPFFFKIRSCQTIESPKTEFNPPKGFLSRRLANESPAFLSQLCFEENDGISCVAVPGEFSRKKNVTDSTHKPFIISQPKKKNVKSVQGGPRADRYKWSYGASINGRK